MRTLLFIFSFLTLSTVSAQKSNLVIFSESGKQFTVILNGVKMNDKPQTNVKITDLTGELFKGKIIFKDGTPDIDKNLYAKPGFQLTYDIKQKKNGEYVLRAQSQTSIASAPTPPAQQQTYAYGNPGAPVMQTTISTTTTTSSSNSQNATNSGQRGNSGSIGINVNINDGQANTNTTTRTTRTTTSSRTTSNNGNGGPRQISAVLNGSSIQLSDGRSIPISYTKLMFPYPKLEMKQPMGAAVTISYNGSNAFSSEVPFNYEKLKVNEYFKLNVKESNQVEWSVKLLAKTGYKLTIGTGGGSGGGCSMNSKDFEGAKKTINAGAFSETKLKIAKQISKSHCLTVDQIMQVCKLMPHEDDKLNYAEYAYNYCADKSNYFKVNNVFSFSDSKEKLSTFIGQQ